MRDFPADDTPFLSIAAVERDTGIRKDTLRVWERRYGFPQPRRDASGDRIYPLDQVERLRRIKRLLEAGHRPARIVSLPTDSLESLIQDSFKTAVSGDASVVERVVAPYLGMLQRHETDLLHRALAIDLLRHGLVGFATRIAGPLNTAVGEAWMRGELQVHEEHLYTEVLQRVLRTAIAPFARADSDSARPRAILTTVPQEPHTLGLLMAEALLTIEGCHCVQLGAQMPLADIASAVRAHAADVVVLSFSTLLPPGQVIESMTGLRRLLPQGVGIWVGGASPALARAPTGVEVMHAFSDLSSGVAAWRHAAGHA